MSEQSQLGPSQDGSVMLDIGGPIGALIIHTGADLLLVELDVSRVDGARPLPPGREPDHTHADGHQHAHDPFRTHVAVRERHGAGGVRFAAIYPGLMQGDYTVWGPDGAARDVVSVRGGEVVELDWR